MVVGFGAMAGMLIFGFAKRSGNMRTRDAIKRLGSLEVVVTRTRCPSFSFVNPAFVIPPSFMYDDVFVMLSMSTVTDLLFSMATLKEKSWASMPYTVPLMVVGYDTISAKRARSLRDCLL